jgi:hypothetical protein
MKGPIESQLPKHMIKIITTIIEIISITILGAVIITTTTITTFINIIVIIIKMMRINMNSKVMIFIMIIQIIVSVMMKISHNMGIIINLKKIKINNKL